MLNFIAANTGTILVGAVLIIVVALIIRNMIKRKRQGKCVGCDGCSGGCHCPSAVHK